MAASILRQCTDLSPILSRSFDSSFIRGFSVCSSCWTRNETFSHRKDGNDSKRMAVPLPSNHREDLPPIKIPNKINRSSTAVLEALASTVRNDLNQPMYTLVDDPFLMSSSDALQKSHLAAYDSGKKAAQVMISMNPEYFTHLWYSEEVPKSLDLVPGKYEHEDPTEEALLERIYGKKVTDAIGTYNAIKSEGGSISLSTQEKFLELLTVFNHEDPENESDISLYITPNFLIDAPFPVNTWKNGSLAEEVFHLMPEKTPKAYCHLIRGMAVNNNREGAFALYNEAKAAGIPIDLYTYNKLLSMASLDTENVADIQHFIEYILKDMASQNVVPDVHTFNSVLGNLRRVSRWRGAKKFALSVMSEMKACGIEPSLSTWAELVSIFYYHKSKVTRDPQLFENILEEMSEQTFNCSNEKDLYFFRRSLRSIINLFPEPRLALKVHQILMNQNNFDFIGNRQLRYGYFKDLFQIVTNIEHTDVIMDLYEKSVPYLFMPPLDIYKALLSNIEMFDTYHYVPRLCADLEWSNLYEAQIAVPLLQTMAKEKQGPELQQQFCDICSTIIKKWKSYRLWRGGPYLDGSVIGDMIIVYLNGGHLDEAQDTLKLFREQRKLQGANPSSKSLAKLTQAFIKNRDYPAVKDLLTLMSDMELEDVSSLVTETEASFDLSDRERNYLKGLVSDATTSSSSDSDSD